MAGSARPKWGDPSPLPTGLEKTDLNPIFLDFPDELQRVEKHISESIRSGCDLLREVADYINPGRGKKLRPRMVILVIRAMRD